MTLIPIKRVPFNKQTKFFAILADKHEITWKTIGLLDTKSDPFLYEKRFSQKLPLLKRQSKVLTKRGGWVVLCVTLAVAYLDWKQIHGSQWTIKDKEYLTTNAIQRLNKWHPREIANCYNKRLSYTNSKYGSTWLDTTILLHRTGLCPTKHI